MKKKSKSTQKIADELSIPEVNQRIIVLFNERVGLTTYQMAKDIGDETKVTTFDGWIKGRIVKGKREWYAPRPETLEPFCVMYGWNLNWIFTGEGEKYSMRVLQELPKEEKKIVDHGSPELWSKFKDEEIKFLRSENERKDREILFYQEIIKNMTSPNK